MNVVVRKYTEEDLTSVNRVLKEAFGVSKNNFSGSEFTEIVAEVDHVVCGYLLLTKVLNPVLNKNYYLVDYVCVLSDYRGMEVSDQLMAYAEELAKETKAMYLQLTCSKFRVAAHKLYERCGYIQRESDIFRKEIL